MANQGPVVPRRAVLGAFAGAAMLGAASHAFVPGSAGTFSGSPRSSRLKLGVIGCGGRGTGAAVNMLEASPDVELHAMGDVFPDRLESSVAELAKEEAVADRCVVPESRRFVGFDAYRQVLATEVDVVVLATPPGFRPIHFAAAIEAGKHVFMEKPAAVCPAGIRVVIEAARAAREKKLSVVAGTQRRHEDCYHALMERIRMGAIGDLVSASVYWMQGGLWKKDRQPAWSDTEWQLRNWLYFTWLSGDHIVEQHVHNLDVAAWAFDALPTRCMASGGRQVRTDPAYGHIFDHFAVEYELPGGRSISSHCRQIDGCASRVDEVLRGSDGHAVVSMGRAEIFGKRPWKWSGREENPYVAEHRALLKGITSGTPINEGEQVAHSTMMAIMGRMSAYTGKPVTWDQAMGSALDLRPGTLSMGPMDTPEIARPGQTPLV
ncbi:MAG: Gfo/Idh/MocA family oxidoreductase [Planctomycetota bacterium]|nr:Gfo/Idh/MocA family oxidoreductase [Planctomycetota bacterium]